MILIAKPRVTLRPATSEDCRLIFQWQQMPEIRRFSRNPGAPSWPEHEVWMARKLADPSCIFRIVVADSDPAGVLRLDEVSRPDPAPEYEVSILIDPRFQGRGVAKTALLLARDLLPDATLVAEILQDNTSSQALFAAAGYRRDEDGLYRWSQAERPSLQREKQ